MAHRTAAEGFRVLIRTPYGRDADAVFGLLTKQGYQALVCDSLEDIADALDENVGVILIAEEGLIGDNAPLVDALERQPPWSDVPFVLLAGRGQRQPNSAHAARDRLPEIATNVIVLERPLGSESLISAIASAMKSRQRQFEMRDRLAELDSQYRRLDVLLQNLPVGVAFINTDKTTLLANPAFRRFRPDGRIPSVDPAGEEQWEGYDETGKRLTRENFATERALAGRPSPPTEYLYHSPGQDPIWTRVSATPLTDGRDRIVGAISVIVDIDDQKKAQKALADAAEQLEAEVAARTADLADALARLRAETEERERAEASLRQSQKMEAIGQLTGGIAHDFNNMLTGIIGSLDIVKRRIAGGRLEGLDRFMDAASTSAQRAAALTQRLLAFSRRQSLDTRPVDVNLLILSLEDLLKRTMSERIKVAIRPGEDLPMARVDANQLESALLNLAINARDAMPDGGTLTIETGLVDLDSDYALTHPDIQPGRYVLLSVADTGVGISPELMEKIYEPFFTTKPIGQGTGLGLSMVYGFVQQSGGQIVLESREGEGTVVKIFLQAGEAEGEDQAVKPHQADNDGAGQTVLVIEDDDSVRLLVQDVLEELGYNAILASHPREAVAVLSSERELDLMVSDVGLPDMNGRQLAEIARAHRSDLPILFITGYAENAAIRSNFLGTNMAMIAKPFTLDNLAAKIGEMLG